MRAIGLISREYIDQLNQSPRHTTFGLSTQSNNIISGIAQQQNLLEKQLVCFQSDPTLFTSLMNDATVNYKYLVKNLLVFLSEPLQPIHKKHLVDSLKKYLHNSTRIGEHFYNNHIDSTIQMIEKVRTRYTQLNEVSRWQRDDVFNSRVNHLTNQSVQLIHMIYDLIHFTKVERIENILKHLFFFSCSALQLRYISNFKGSHDKRIEAISMCVDQLDLTRNSIHQITLHKLASSISIYSTLHYIKTQSNDHNLTPKDLSLINSKLTTLDKWLASLASTHVDIKTNYDDVKQLLKQCHRNMENKNFKWDEITMVVDSLELFLVKLKAEVMLSSGNTLKSTLHQFNTLISSAKKSNAQQLSLASFRDLFQNLTNNAAIMSLLAEDENHASEILFSSHKLDFVSMQVLFVVEHWFSLNCVKDCNLYQCMMNYLSSLWRQIYYKYLADLHRTIEFSDYFALLEDLYFSAAKEAIRSISTGKSELFQSKSVSIATLLDYMLCYVRDKFLCGQSNDQSEVILNKIQKFRDKSIRKFYRACTSVHRFIISNPNVMLPQNYLQKFERLCSNIQSELHDFTSLYNIHDLIRKMNITSEKLVNKIPLKTVKLFVEQIYDNQISSNVVSSKISINNTTCSIEYDPCVCFVVVNEYGNAVIDVRVYQIGDPEIINFLKCLTPNTLLVVSVVNNSNSKIPDHLINYFTLIDCQVFSKFQRNNQSPTQNDLSYNSAILVGYVSRHRYVTWYHTQTSILCASKSTHIFNDNVLTPLTYGEVVKIEIRQVDPSSSSSVSHRSLYDNTPTPFQTSISINGIDYMKPINSIFSENNSDVGCGYCYVFESSESPYYGSLIQVKSAEIEDFIGGLTIGSVCCFVFPYGIGDAVEIVARFFDIPIENMNPNNNFSAIYINSDVSKKGDNFRYVNITPTVPIHFIEYIKTNQTNPDSSLFVSNASPNDNFSCATDSQNNIHSLIKKIKKQDGDKIDKLNKEFDQLQSDFLSQIRRSSQITTHCLPLEYKDQLPSSDNFDIDNNLLTLAKRISFLVSHIVDLTRNEGPLVTDKDIINNCREIKRLGESMISACSKIADQCQKGTTKSEITGLMEELPLFLQQLLVISKVNYGSVYSRYKGQNDPSQASQMASSLIVSSSNILKTVINLLKLTHSAKVQYKLNIDINPLGNSNGGDKTLMSQIKDLQDSIQKPSTI